jgi:hypothetical protein
MKSQEILTGIEAISHHAKKPFEVLLEWTHHYEFPMENVQGRWQANPGSIDQWFAQFKKHPKEITTAYLTLHEYKKARAAGQHKVRRKVIDLKNIADFAGVSSLTAFEWFRYYEGCPISQNQKTRQLEVDADSLIDWILDNELVHGMRGIPKPRGGQAEYAI